VNITLAAEDNLQAFMEYTSKWDKSYHTVEEFQMRHSLFNKVEA